MFPWWLGRQLRGPQQKRRHFVIKCRFANLHLVSAEFSSLMVASRCWLLVVVSFPVFTVRCGYLILYSIFVWPFSQFQIACFTPVWYAIALNCQRIDNDRHTEDCQSLTTTWSHKEDFRWSRGGTQDDIEHDLHDNQRRSEKTRTGCSHPKT